MKTTVFQDPELGEVSWKIVDSYYKGMSSPDEQTRKLANKWLNAFYHSEHAGQIANDLLEYGDQANQLLAISILDAKQFTNIALSYERSVTIGAQIVEKILKRTEYLAYSREVDNWIIPYTIEYVLKMSCEQI
jgi:hypothetical protein